MSARRLCFALDLRDEPEAIAADIDLTARILIQCLPTAGPYQPGAPSPPRSSASRAG